MFCLQYYVVMATHESGAFIHVHQDKSKWEWSLGVAKTGLVGVVNVGTI